MSDDVCQSYCSHGGVCDLEPRHEGLHDSNFCTWSDADALSRADADAAKPGGDFAVTLYDKFVE